MLEGWRQQQLSRNLAFGTVDARLDLLRRFQDHSGEFPWQWTPQHLEEWSTDLRAVRGLALSTVRAYQLAIRSFLGYVCEPFYGWDVECEKRFGTHPIQISHDWNSAKHILDVEGRPQRRALTRQELQLLFDAADEMVEEIRRNGRKGAVAAFRDAAMLKTAYAFGLRRRELVRLEVHDFGRNPKATEFGDFGVCYIRFGKGSGPKRRSVLTVMPWSVTDDRQALATYIRWHHRHRILQQLDNGAVRASAFSTARQQSRAALDFLNWLRARGTLLAECTQHDIDDWFADGPTTRLLARIFMTFAIRRRLCPKLRIPNQPRGVAPTAQPQPERIALVRKLFTDDTLPPIDRVVGLLVLLYDMPATRIAQIRLDDVTTDSGQVFLRIAEEDLPMPEPLGCLITDLTAQRRNMGTAANLTSPWMLPGQRPNRPISTARLRERLRRLGVTGAGRVAAFNELLREIPAPVLADLVGCNPKFAAERASLLAADWSTYAAIRARRAPSHP